MLTLNTWLNLELFAHFYSIYYVKMFDISIRCYNLFSNFITDGIKYTQKELVKDSDGKQPISSPALCLNITFHYYIDCTDSGRREIMSFYVNIFKLLLFILLSAMSCVLMNLSTISVHYGNL